MRPIDQKYMILPPRILVVTEYDSAVIFVLLVVFTESRSIVRVGDSIAGLEIQRRASMLFLEAVKVS